MKKIAMLLIGEIKYDGRVQKEIKTLTNHGYEVELIVSRFVNDEKEKYNFKIYNIGFDKKDIPNALGKLKFCIKAYSLLKKSKPDIVHCNDLCTLLAGYLYKNRNRNCKFIYDSHELYPEMHNRILKRTFWTIIEKILIHKVDEIISAEENRAAYMKKKYRLNKEIYTICNYPMQIDRKSKNYIEEKFPLTRGKIKVLYLGEVDKGRCIEEMIKAFKHITDEYVFILIGKMSSKAYRKEIEEIIISNSVK